MNFLEKDLEDIIFQANNNELRNKGLGILGKKYRQLKIGNYGIADVVTIQRGKYNKKTKKHTPLIITVFELKKGDINNEAFFQAVRYIKGISQYLKGRRGCSLLYVFKVVLIGKNKPIGDLIYLPDYVLNAQGDKFLEIYTYNYKIDGLLFDRISGYSLINEGF